MAELEFSLDQPQGEFNIFPPSGPRAAPASMLEMEMLIALRSQRTGESIGEIREKITALGIDFFAPSSRRDASFSVEDEFNRKVKRGIESTSLPSIIEADEERERGLEVAANTEVPEVVATVFASSAFDRKDAIALSRVIGLRKLIEEELEKEEVSIGTIAVDLLDMFISIPIDALRLGGFSRVDDAIRLRNLISAEMPDKEFYAIAREIIKDGADAGILTESNFFFLSAIAGNLLELGEGETAKAEELFNVLDLTGVAVGAARIVRLLKNATTAAALLSGPEGATKVLIDGVSQPNTSVAEAVGVARETSVSVLRPIESGGAHFDMVAAGAAISQGMEKTNTIFKIIRSAPFFRDVDPKVLEEWLPIGLRRLSERLDEQSRRRVWNLTIEQDELSNIIGTVVFGKSNGMPFKSLRAAKNHAEDVNGKVLPLPFVGEPRFVVGVEKNLSREGLATTLDASEIGQSFMRAFGGTFLSIPERLRSLALFGESALAGVAKKVGRILEKALKNANKEETRIVEQVFYELRDGDRLGQRRSALNMNEFRSEYRRHSKDNVGPSKGAEELYSTIQELNDALYFFKADVEYKRVVDAGSETLEFSLARANGDVDEWTLIVNRVERDSLPDDLVVFNTVSGLEMPVSELSRRESIFLVKNPNGYRVGERTARYVTSESPSLRRVFHSDVFGYNAGGPRGYDGQYSHIVKQRTLHTDLNGVESVGRDRALMLVKSDKQGRAAAEEINRIFDAFREAVPNLRNLSLSNAINAIKALRTTPHLEEVIRLNTRWRTDIEDIDDLVAFMLKNELDPRINVGVAAKGEVMAVLDDSGKPIFGARAGETYDELVSASLNQPRNSPRRNIPLPEFGGETAETISPLDLIQSDFMKVTHARAFQSFVFRSVNGWLDGARDFITPKGKAAMVGLDPVGAMKAADFGLRPNAEGRSFMAARDAILRTLNNKTELEIKWNGMIDNFGEYLFDKDWKRLSKILRNSKLAKTPIEFLRAMTFDARLGLLDPAQLIIQASQSFNILAVLGPLRGGEWLQSMASHLPLRLAMRTDDPAILKEIGRRAGPFIGMDADEFVSWATWVKDSSRLSVGEEVIEIAGQNTTLARSFGRKVRVGTRFFFNEGEKVPRSSALHVAWKEYREKFPKGDPFSDHGKRTIIARQDSLTAGMVSSNRAAWQRGPMSLPLQFMSYSSRMIESIFTDRLLSRAERKRLVTAQFIFWGAAGTGFSAVLDGYLLEAGIEMDTTQFTLLKYGALDASLQWATGTQAIFGDRLAMAEGFSDLMGNITQGNFLEAAGGPGGQLVTDIGLQLMEGFGNIANGRTSMLKVDIIKLVRNFTGPNKFYNAWAMWTLGDYLSRNGDVIVSGVSKTDTFLHVFGGQIGDANLAYDRIEVMQDQDATLREHGNVIRKMMRVMQDKTEAGDFQGALAAQDQISAMFAMIEPWKADKLRFSLLTQLDSLAETVMQRAVFDRGMLMLSRERGGE